MSVAIYETVPVGAVEFSHQKYVHVWTSVTAPAVDRPRGMATLIVLPGFRHALSARIYETADDVAIEDPATGVFGAGDSLPAAMADFSNALQDHLEVLSEQDALSPDLQRQLDLLKSYFDPGTGH